jgi:hypothetical protein
MATVSRDASRRRHCDVHTELTDAFRARIVLPPAAAAPKMCLEVRFPEHGHLQGVIFMRTSLTFLSVAAGGLALAGAMVSPPLHRACAQQAQISYSENIAPIFRGWCVSCHQPGGTGYKASGLDLTNYAGLMKGTKFGRMVIPGQPDSSNLYVLISGRAKIQMPFGHKPLPSCLQQNVWTWIFQGAKNN